VYLASPAASDLGEVIPGDDSEFTLEVIEPPTPNQGTRRVWSDSTGVLWTSEWNAGQVGRFDPVSGEWNEWRLPGDSPQAYAVYVDERDDVWLSDFGANALVRFDPDTETFVTVPLPHAEAQVRQILGRPGEVWGAESGADALVVVRTDCV
jgi:virginiamycin B lyase